ncbi:MAG: ABC-F family ATP-binding cassette domain-containing protein [Alphaproteobacteria bacterium]|nr:ABC-F family ATP-binding cassette domain-containing protein [Alphaproteobacteria bacterium]
MVSHDRHFLNAATTLTLHLDRGKLTLYSGGFDAYMRARTEAERRLEVMARRQASERQRMQAFVDRFRAKASKARQAQRSAQRFLSMHCAVHNTLQLSTPPDLPIHTADLPSRRYCRMAKCRCSGIMHDEPWLSMCARQSCRDNALGAVQRFAANGSAPPLSHKAALAPFLSDLTGKIVDV